MYIIVFSKFFDFTTNGFFFIVITPCLKLYVVGFGLVRIVQSTTKTPLNFWIWMCAIDYTMHEKEIAPIFETTITYNNFSIVTIEFGF